LTLRTLPPATASIRLRLLIALALAIAAAACGSSTTTSTSTAPATVSRCGVTIGATDLTVPSSGGSGTLAVTTARECAWTASSNAAWLTIRGASNGQGDGSVEYVAAENTDPATRRAVIELNDKRANVTQAAGECTMRLGATSATFSPAGGSGTIDVQASSAMCTWTAESDAGWVVIRDGGSGKGNGRVEFDVAPASGPPRTATVLVAGLRFAVTQSEGCTYAASPLAYATGASGGTTTVAVTTGAGCPWTAASNVSWAHVTEGATGAGTGGARIVVDPTSGPTRTGTVLVAGQRVTLTQSNGCSFDVGPLSQSFGASGGNGSATVGAADGCEWTASSGASWIALTGATSGSGGGTIAFTVAPVTGPARTGTINVAGTQISVSQSAGCTFAIAPQSQEVGAAGGDVTVNVTAGDGCAWTAVSKDNWITVAAGSSGSGNGTVKLSVGASSGGSRTGSVTIAGQAFTVTQGSGCTYSISPTTASIPSAGWTGSVAVTAGAGCSWTATSNASWLTINSGGSGTGNGTVQYSAPATAGGQRSGTMTIAGQTFTVNQGSGCAFAISPGSASVPSTGGTGSIAVTTDASCSWTVNGATPWLTITSGASGSGNGKVDYKVDATTGAARSATLTIADQTFTLNQASGCSVTIVPDSMSIAAGGGTGTVGVTAGPGCTWTAASSAQWLSVTAGAAGSGDGTVHYSAEANTTAARSATLTIAGQTFTVNQASGCAFVVAPTSIAIGEGGGPATITVSAPQGCTWSASSGVGWIAITGGASGNGDGTTQIRIDPNTAASPRTGTATVAGETINVSQAAAVVVAPTCTYVLEPDHRRIGRRGESGSFAVHAGPGCQWTATSTVPWITVPPGTMGTGEGTVPYTVDRNDDHDDRTGTIAVADKVFTVDQRD
jgi:hypothetical protein